jgi:hypothetical protein
MKKANKNPTTPREKRLLITTRPNGTRRVQTVPFGTSLTDQSDKNSCDVNVMMKQYAKTGMLPSFSSKEPVYADVSEIPDFLTAHKLMQEANYLFLELPAEVRALMDHDPSRLGEFVKDPKNKEVCEEYGLIKKEKEPPYRESQPKKKQPQTVPDSKDEPDTK